MFNLLFLLPQIFNVGYDIKACLEGGTSKEEWDKMVDDMSNLVLSIPELQGYIAIVQSLIKIAKLSFPLFESLDGFNTDEVKRLTAARDQISKEDLIIAYNSIKLLAAISERVAEINGVKKEDNSDKPEYKYYEDKFDTGTFFDTQLNNSGT